MLEKSSFSPLVLSLHTGEGFHTWRGLWPLPPHGEAQAHCHLQRCWQPQQPVPKGLGRDWERLLVCDHGLCKDNNSCLDPELVMKLEVKPML